MLSRWMDGSAVYKGKEENQGREAGLWIDAWMEGQMDRCEDGRQEGQLWEGGQVERWMEGWLDNGWKKRSTDGKVDRRKGGRIDK